MGKTRDELVGQTLLKVELYNYLMQPIEPNSTIVIRNDSEATYEITNEVSQHYFARREGAGILEDWQLQNNTMVVTGAETTQTQEIVSVFYFRFAQLNTSEQSYTKFKYIQ